MSVSEQLKGDCLLMIIHFKKRYWYLLSLLFSFSVYAFPTCGNFLWPSIVNIGQPKDDKISLSDFFAFMAIVISIATLIYTAWFNINGNKKSVKEIFWMREVLIPKFLDNFFAFIQNSPAQYKAFNLSPSEFYRNYALGEINSIRDSSKWLRVSSETLEASIISHIEDFEDDMMAVTDYDGYVNLVFNLSSSVIKDIQNVQLDA